MIRRDESAVAEVLDLVDAAVYADVFDSAVSFTALHRFGRVRIDREILASRLTDDPLVREAVERDGSGAIALSGRSAVAAAYPDRIRRAALLRGRALRVARVLRHTPFVRGDPAHRLGGRRGCSGRRRCRPARDRGRRSHRHRLRAARHDLAPRRAALVLSELLPRRIAAAPATEQRLHRSRARAGRGHRRRCERPAGRESVVGGDVPEPWPTGAGTDESGKPATAVARGSSQRECGRSGGASRSPARPVAPPHALRGR